MKKQILLLIGLVIAGTSVAVAQDDTKTVKAQIQGSIFKPGKKPATGEMVKKLKLPEGFTISKYAENLGKPRMIAISDAGNVYVTRREKDDVVLLKDNNNDGKSDETKPVATLKNVHGIAINQGKMYLATVKEVYVADINSDGTLGEPKVIMNDLPDGGQHPNRTLGFGPDGQLYISVGSTCNACDEPNPENATILVAQPDGSGRRIFAKGLRNTLGFDWHPETREMYGMDHGIDWLGDNEPHEELNKLEDGADYGWPYIYDEGKHNPGDQPKNMTYAQYAAKTKKPVLLLEPHSAALDFKFYTGAQFPREYLNNAFVALHGSWNRAEPSGYKIVRIRFENGKPMRAEDFVTGFLINNNQNHIGRPVGIAQHNDGSLFFTDDANGIVYRVTYAANNSQPKKPGR
ncbi:MAG: PQQ-dependent sugar dehydrogenase [Hymenobacteraceae bacterium]|nr:PQQ-dependent sugar dehydrogenase [Hymenobacteraceae bacterium]MDX5395858.1 PQQ-dependent sugar dehydrogenase [Hymenobacteraceae bacterium]MDX5444245.1 PQQ-dependent sugar dehydrogenase [Hymenobacteraceae bacterium]MDX5511913.1 PQQ-dependent sugar dehydrogenase [Hymenobacteraceae bacterium]